MSFNKNGILTNIEKKEIPFENDKNNEENNMKYINSIILKIINIIIPTKDNKINNFSENKLNDILEYLNKNEGSFNFSKTIEKINNSIKKIDEKIVLFQNKVDILEKKSTSSIIKEELEKLAKRDKNSRNIEFISSELSNLKNKVIVDMKKNIKNNEISIKNTENKLEEKINNVINDFDNKLLKFDNNVKLELDRVEKDLSESKDLIKINQNNIKECINQEIDKTLQNYESKVLQDFLNVNTDMDKNDKKNSITTNQPNTPIMNIYYQKLFFQENFKSLLDDSFNKCLSKIHASINKLRKEIRHLQLFQKRRNLYGSKPRANSIQFLYYSQNKKSISKENSDIMNLTQKSNILNKSIEINKKDLLMNKSLKRLSSKSLSFEKKKNKIGKSTLIKKKEIKKEIKKDFIKEDNNKPRFKLKEKSLELILNKNNSQEKSPKKIQMRHINNSFLPTLTQFKQNSKGKIPKGKYNYKSLLNPINEV